MKNTLLKSSLLISLFVLAISAVTLGPINWNRIHRVVAPRQVSITIDPATGVPITPLTREEIGHAISMLAF